MNKLTLLKHLDRIIRAMGLIGGFGVAIFGIFLGLWDGNTGALIYAMFFVGALVYSCHANGKPYAPGGG